jgi:peptide/nickel transport system permease protein
LGGERAALDAGRRDWILIGSALVCVLFLVSAFAAPLIAPYSPNAIDVSAANQGPSAAHLFGTDAIGRDTFSRVLYGARISLLEPAVVTACATILGTLLALVGSWRGGWTDRLLVRVLDVLFATPALLLAILGVAIFGTGLVAPAVALSIAYTPYIARVIRSTAVTERRQPYIEASLMLGFSNFRTMTFHLLRNVSLLVVSQATITYGFVLLDLAALSFIGLGVQPPAAEWGLMVSQASISLLNGYLAQALSPGIAIVIAVVAFNVLGERLGRRVGRRR